MQNSLAFCRGLVAVVWLALLFSVHAVDGANPGQERDRLGVDSNAQVPVSVLHTPGIGQRVAIEEVSLEGRILPVDLELKRIRVFSDDAQIVVHTEKGDQILDPPDNAYYVGSVVGAEHARVFLTSRGDGSAHGMVAADGLVWSMSVDGQEDPWVFRKLDEDLLKSGNRTFACGTDSITPSSDALGLLFGSESAIAYPPASVAKTTASYTARVAVETDWEFYQVFGNAPDATDYVADLIGFASGIYADEVDTSLVVSHLSLWSTSSDPWDETSTFCGLFEFGQYWNYNQTGVERTVAHFMSGKYLSGGVAWTGVLCSGSFNPAPWGYTPSALGCNTLTPDSDIYGGAYGFTANISGGFNAGSPSPVWDIISVSHEIGHNFSSPHTHCYKNIGGNANPVDECYAGNECTQNPGSCNCATPNLPCAQSGAGCGTIMSYCHHTTGLVVQSHRRRVAGGAHLWRRPVRVLRRRIRDVTLGLDKSRAAYVDSLSVL